jgi:hypothetical protein
MYSDLPINVLDLLDEFHSRRHHRIMFTATDRSVADILRVVEYVREAHTAFLNALIGASYGGCIL